MILSTWFYSSPSGENFYYPSVGDNSGDESFQLCYFQCVIDFFASSFYKNNLNVISGEIKHIFFCNKIPNFVDKLRFSELMREFKVEIIQFIPKRIPDFSRSKNLTFGSVFAEIDVVELLASMVDDDEYVYLMDNDVLINKSLSGIDPAFISGKPVVFKQQSGALDQLIQGRPLIDLMKISNQIEYDLKIPMRLPYVHTGGELVSMDGSSLKRFSNLCNLIYDANVQLEISGGDFFETEEQVFSCAYSFFEEIVFSDYIDRIWTDASKYRTVTGFEADLHFLHIPSEKRAGFVAICQELIHEFDSGELNMVSLERIFSFDHIKNLCRL